MKAHAVRQRRKEYARRTQADLNPPPLLTGHDLARQGLKPGPDFKKCLDAVREGQLDGTIKSTSAAMQLVAQMLEAEKRRGQ